MSLQEVPYKVENLTTGTPVDITENIASIDSLNFQGSGRIRTASFMLNAQEGAFITNPDFQGVGKTPQINQFDKIKIEFEDDLSRKKSIILEVDQELGQKNQSGVLLPIELKGREAALQRHKFTAFFRFKSPNFVLEELRRRYNNDRALDEPVLRFRTNAGTIDHNESPSNIVNIYDFTQEISYYDAIMQVIRRLNQPIGAGGVGDFFSLTFEDAETIDPPLTGIVMNVFVQGANVTPIPTIITDPDNPTHSTDYMIQSESGTQIFVRGEVNTGYMPVEFHRFISFVEEINNLPAYDNDVTYITGIRVRGGDNELYEANQFVPTNNAPPSAFWNLTDPDLIIGFTNYSPWTNDTNAVAIVKNSGANAQNSFLIGGFDAPAFMDGNMVIKEGFNSTTGEFIFFRDFVWMRVKDDGDIQTDPVLRHYLFQQITAGLYNGFRVVVDSSLGALGGRFAANGGFDKFGRPFADSMVIFNGEDWIVFRQPQVGDQAIVITEGRTYEYNATFTQKSKFGAAHKAGKFRGTPGPLAWRDVSDTAGGNDVFHHPKSIERVQGLFPQDIDGDDYFNFVNNSAIKITYTYTLFDEIEKFFGKFNEFFSDPLGSLIALFETVGIDGFDNIFEPDPAAITETQQPSYYDFGWWYTIAFPYPWSTLGGVPPPGLGFLYGQSTPGSTGTQREFAVLDLQNANFTHSGFRGLNTSQVSDLGGPFTGFHFYFLFDIFIGPTTQKPFAGDIDFTVTMYDDLSQVWRTDFVYRFLGDAQEIFLPFSSFTVDRPSRTPWGINTLFSNIVTPELEIRSIFDQKRVRFMTIQLNDSYDDKGRFLPMSLDNLIVQVYNLGDVRFEGTIDALTLTKQPFVSSGVEFDRVINPETLQMPNVRNIRQLESIAIAQRDIAGLQFEQYTVTQDGSCDLVTEQSVFLSDEDLIKFSDVGPNTRKLIVMSEELSFNANGEKSGFIRTVKLTRRLNA